MSSFHSLAFVTFLAVICCTLAFPATITTTASDNYYENDVIG
uniref:Uncharacterized protein n=1 Tax=Panagrolaimus sp. PS1159 TaxID=55785 RepID=A0AC35FMI2_9BILA